MSSSSNVFGQAYGFMSMTPIAPGEEGALRSYLEGLRARGPSPLSKVAGTHIGRWVIVEKFNCEPAYDQPHPETLEIPYLIFTSNFDGELDPYLDRLCAALADEAPEIWGRCIGCPRPPGGPQLKAYLKHNQIDSGFFFAAYGHATVSQVRASLDQRERLIAFATRMQGKPAAELQQAFIDEFPRLMARPLQIDLGDLQGDILRAYGNDYACTSYAFVQIACPPPQAQAWLAGLLDHVTTAQPWTEGKPATTLNVGLTAAGLTALGVSGAVLASFAAEFAEGMARRAGRLGDVADSDPAGWEPGLGTGEAHVLLTINAREPADRERALAKMAAAIGAVDGLHVVHQQDAELLPGAREHFGFADGFAQPAIAGSSDERARGGGVPEKDGAWRALAPGEFVLGYPDEDTRDDPKGRLPTRPDGPLGRSGTYMVWRKLHQDVGRWRRVLAASAKLYADGDEAKLAAKVVGRWADGTPLVTNPSRPAPGFDPSTPAANDFRYDGDRDGRRCPIGAHIRRSNPRDALGFDGALSFRHRMIRRGMPYGPPLAADAVADDGADRGLVFVCFQASISRQFEAVQMQWLNDGNIFGLGHDKDFLLGDASGTGKMTIQGDPPFFLAPQESFVTTRGGEYLFVPGMRALAALAAGKA